jgi:hypothetical protein
MSDYWDKAKATAINEMRGELMGWSEQDIADAADELLGRGFGRPGFGVTARVVANTLRKVKPIASFDEAKVIAVNLNRANRELTTTKTFDAEPYRCTHCDERFREALSPKTHFTPHTTVFDPRTY